MLDIKVFFMVSMFVTGSVAGAQRMVTLAEKRKILTDELATTIVTMVAKSRSAEVISKLGEIVFQQRKGLLLQVSDFNWQQELELELTELRRVVASFSATPKALSTAEVRLEDDDSATGRLFAAVQQQPQAAAMPTTTEEIRERVLTRLAEVEEIVAISEVAAQREAYANYSAALKSKEIEGYLVMGELAAAGGQVLAQDDMESIVKSEYLDDLLDIELQGLAMKLGRDDLSELKTGLDLLLQDGQALRARRRKQEEVNKKAEIKKLMKVLDGIIDKRENT